MKRYGNEGGVRVPRVRSRTEDVSQGRSKRGEKESNRFTMSFKELIILGGGCLKIQSVIA